MSLSLAPVEPASGSRWDAARRAAFVRDRLPSGGLFADQDWRIAPAPFSLGLELTREFTTLGRVLLQFYRAVNLLYRLSVAGKQPSWIADLLDRGKPPDLLAIQRAPAFKNELPRVLRPDILLTDSGYTISELDSVPGGIGLTAWLNQTYSLLRTELDAEQQQMRSSGPLESIPPEKTAPGPGEMGSSGNIIGGADGMLGGFVGIFGGAHRIHVVVSDESATYRPEMEWIASQSTARSVQVHGPQFREYSDGDAVYRFFELFDLANVPAAEGLIRAALEKRILLTPAPKPIFEEKLLFALLWNRNLRGFWRQELGQAFFERLQRHVPYTWVLDPSPLPPQAAYPELNLTDWQQLKTLSQRDRELILKVSGYSERAWGARGVFLGNDLSLPDWSAAVDGALDASARSPYILQRYHKPRLVDAAYYDFEGAAQRKMSGRVRLCPYYFVTGEAEAARAELGGVLATICPADKKIIHGMRDAILVPCVA